MITDTTIITAYFKIPSKLPHSNYKAYLENFVKNVACRCFFYTTQDVADELAHITNPYIQYVITEFPSYEDFDDVFWKKQIERDVEKYHTFQLAKMWYAKKDFVLRTIATYGSTINLDSHNFIWCDAGCIRHLKSINAAREFGRRLNTCDDKIHLQINHYTTIFEKKIINGKSFYIFPTCYIAGAIIYGNAHSWVEYKKIYDQVLKEYDDGQIAGSSDQYITLSCIDRCPTLFQAHMGSSVVIDDWFFFLGEI